MFLLQSCLSLVLLLEYSFKKSLDIGLVHDGDVYKFSWHGSTVNICISTRFYTALFLSYFGGESVSITKPLVSRPAVGLFVQEIIWHQIGTCWGCVSFFMTSWFYCQQACLNSFPHCYIPILFWGEHISITKPLVSCPAVGIFTEEIIGHRIGTWWWCVSIFMTWFYYQHACLNFFLHCFVSTLWGGKSVSIANLLISWPSPGLFVQ